MRRATIKKVKARVCFNSRGEETVEVDIQVGDQVGRASSPSGASVGKFEAVGLPDGGASRAVELIARYSKRLVGLDASDPASISRTLREIDGTGNFSRIGGAAAYAASLAAAEAASRYLRMPLFKLLRRARGYRLPLPLGNVLGGGKHAGKGAPDIQEFLICPLGAKSFREALECNRDVHREVRKRIEEKDSSFSGGRGDEGGWAPHLPDDKCLELVSKAIEIVSQERSVKMALGIDFAASSLWDEGSRAYLYNNWGARRDSGEQLDYASEIIGTYKLFYVEDPFHDEDFEDFAELLNRKRGTLIVGDDLFATNRERLASLSRSKVANAAIVKVNQAGTLGDALEFAKEARRRGMTVIASHRSGESVDAHLAHVAIATDSVMIKSGIVGGERVAKLNELLRISDLYSIRSLARVHPTQ